MVDFPFVAVGLASFREGDRVEASRKRSSKTRTVAQHGTSDEPIPHFYSGSSLCRNGIEETQLGPAPRVADAYSSRHTCYGCSSLEGIEHNVDDVCVMSSYSAYIA